MKKALGNALFILLLAVMSACSNGEPADEKANAPATEQGDGEKGAPAEKASPTGNEVFQKSCITCHSSGDIVGGQVKLDGTKIQSDFKTKEDLLAFVSKNMPKSARGSLSPEEYDAVVKYLWEQK